MTRIANPTDAPAQRPGALLAVLPFWMTFGLIPLVWLAALQGGWWLALPVVATWYLVSALDAALGLNPDNADPDTPDDALRLYRLLTAAWVPAQAISLFALIAYAAQATHLGGWEKVGLFFGIGVMTGTVGITYAHELLHQRNRAERWLGDLLLAMVLYSHFRSEHLLVHHRYVGTPRDPVSARKGEGFHRFYPRVLRQSLVSAFRAEAAMLARRDRPWWSRGNPFWRYLGLQAAVIGLAAALGGWVGVGLLAVQAGTAIWQLEIVNYVEHYGLTRKHLGGGRYEPVRPHHSWNASHRASNWLLINLQRHSDHHYKPDRRFPLLQTYPEHEAPQLPAGYPLMTMAAMVPPLWRRIMDPRVKAWRKRHYPEITDWRPYNRGETPLPR